MATNYERVSKGLDELKAGLAPFVERELHAAIHSGALSQDTIKGFAEDPMLADKSIAEWDASALLKIMWETWNNVFRKTLGFSERSLVSEIRNWRNKWAHQEAFSTDNVYRALDSITRLLISISATSQADNVEKSKQEILRAYFEEQSRGERRKSTYLNLESSGTKLKPWRDVIMPHQDVASGQYQQAEFAADLWQVHCQQEGSEEYLNPIEFFRRTYLTDSLTHILLNAIKRLNGKGGDPVIQLQTNFGGWKTHSMLALYHLFSHVKATELSGIDDLLMKSDGLEPLPVKRVVLVGNRISPGNPSTKPDGTVVHTLWGEIAYQLGGSDAFAKIALDDQRATSPGDRLKDLFNEYGPCMILIDEWVAYARQLHDDPDLPGGSFDRQFTFAQALSESVKLAKNCLLVVSLPASDTSSSSTYSVDEIEVGGTRGHDALERLRNVIGRLESAWRPANAEEAFEIVRRRLFQPMVETSKLKDRDVIARFFVDFYRSQPTEFPPELQTTDYEKRIKAAYPIHPELFDRLYKDWSTLVGFQRTRGVLRLMSAVIHQLWESGDASPMILPAHVGVSDQRILSELMRHLPDNWSSIIEKDIDGPDALPLQLDREKPNFGKLTACKRVARTIYMGSAPLTGTIHKGLEDRHIKLGCVLPGESTAVFGDALRKLSSEATYLYTDGTRYWYSTQPTITKLAQDEAQKISSNEVYEEIGRRIRENIKQKGWFEKVHVMPISGADVADELSARLVILRPNDAYHKDGNSNAERQAKSILDKRGNAPRLYQNTLIFLAADETRLQNLEEAIRKFLAWKLICSQEIALNLDPQQQKQADKQKEHADSTVHPQLLETYRWLLVPAQSSKDQRDIIFESLRLSGSDELAVRASDRLAREDYCVRSFDSSNLRGILDSIPLWQGQHVCIKDLVEYFARYIYLQRFFNPDVLLKAIANGVGLMTWQQDSFALADAFDEATARYTGLRVQTNVSLDDPYSPALIVKADVAAKQLEEDQARTNSLPKPIADETAMNADQAVVTTDQPTAKPDLEKKPKHFHASAQLDASRIGRDAGQIAEEVIAHITSLVDVVVKVTIQIDAEIPEGASNELVRVVNENCQTLKFDRYEFYGD